MTASAPEGCPRCGERLEGGIDCVSCGYVIPERERAALARPVLAPAGEGHERQDRGLMSASPADALRPGERIGSGDALMSPGPAAPAAEVARPEVAQIGAAHRYLRNHALPTMRKQLADLQSDIRETEMLLGIEHLESRPADSGVDYEKLGRVAYESGIKRNKPWVLLRPEAKQHWTDVARAVAAEIETGRK